MKQAIIDINIIFLHAICVFLSDAKIIFAKVFTLIKGSGINIAVVLEKDFFLTLLIEVSHGKIKIELCSPHVKNYCKT